MAYLDIELTCKEIPSLSFNPKDKRYQKVVLYDSMLQYFPACQIVMNDAEGLLSEQVGYIESLDFKVKISNPSSSEFIEGNFYWNSNTLAVSRGSSNHMNGYYEMLLGSSFQKQDFIKSKAYRGKLNDIVRSIYLKYVFPRTPVSKNLFISSCDNTDTWFQANETDSEFIDREVKNCYSKSFPSSPFMSFFNMRSEYFFMPFEEFFSSQKPKKTIYLTQDYQNEIKQPNRIGSYAVNIANFSEKYPLYNMDAGYYDDNGEYVRKNSTLQNYTVKVDSNSKGTLMIPKKELLLKRGKAEFGLIESSRLNNFRGQVNTLYLPQLTTYELVVKLDAALDVACGDIIETRFQSSERSDKIDKYHSGKWLVLSHMMELSPSDAHEQPTSTLTLCKPSLPVEQYHPMFNSFVKGR